MLLVVLVAVSLGVVHGIYQPCKIPEGNYYLVYHKPDSWLSLTFYGAYTGEDDPKIGLKAMTSKKFSFQLTHSAHVPPHSKFYQAQFRLRNIAPLGTWEQFKDAPVILGERASWFQPNYYLALAPRDHTGIEFITYCESSSPNDYIIRELQLQPGTVSDTSREEMMPDSYLAVSMNTFSGMLYTGAPKNLAATFQLRRV